ncbi:hypothetical protein BN7_804 [Wickerhamomyces ciferrii]|uniref:Phosphatidylglycerophosphatase GEP4, mitochondrial n=1 Tax=Wickerhamomyces ciferrii (strain ATCC 14091 / BCRC 22168 / CBS 111 / JCM 3599 / NBRC 0793 / NRRL Y-1031 F-60-10) TaxID=1206466 RepID=K0KGH4_WICCF|nr:uncharacterized protein BN7_804 [Wickerhamomyces ciferrii]CCH41267.1 hypothetical protein BN7_804 [Wickerhamomyces ciferrii]
MNVSATLNVFRLLFSPSYCIPHLTVSSFDKLPIPLVFPNHKPNIRAIVLDKDNCFAKAHDDKETWARLRKQYPDASLLIVSNSAGTNDDKHHEQAKILEERTGVSVLRHTTKKPGCHTEIMDYFIQNKIVSDPEEVAVIGDRLFTDILMANMMGSWGIWISEGVIRSESLICKIERGVHSQLTGSNKPLLPPIPKIKV